MRTNKFLKSPPKSSKSLLWQCNLIMLRFCNLVFLLLGLYFCNSLYSCLGCLVLVPPRQSEHHAKPGLRAGSGNQGDFSLSQNCPFRHHPHRKDIFKAGFCALPVHSVQLFHMDFPLQLHLNWPKPDFKYLPNLHHPIYIIYI